MTDHTQNIIVALACEKEPMKLWRLLQELKTKDGRALDKDLQRLRKAGKIMFVKGPGSGWVLVRDFGSQKAAS